MDSITATFLEEFREPRSIVDAIIRVCGTSQLKPAEILEKLFPAIQSFIADGILLSPDSAEAESRGPHLSVGVQREGMRVLRCLQELDDCEVYLVKFGDDVAALKILTGPREVAEQLAAREVSVLRCLDGQVGPRLLRVGVIDDHPFFLMEWIKGVSCMIAADELRNDQHLASEVGLLRLCQSIANAYASIHELGVLHGDVHLRNVLVDKDGLVRIIDFGLGTVLNQQSVIQPRGGVGFFFDPAMAAARLDDMSSPLTPLGEQYSVAALIYLLIAGRHYIDFPVDQDAAMAAILAAPMRPLHSRDGADWAPLEAILATALSKAPGNRYRSVAEMAAKLESFLGGLPRPMEDSANKGACESLKSLSRHRIDQNQTRFAADGKLLHDGIEPEPTCSINYGAAGVAYSLYRLSCIRNDASLLSLADQWCRQALVRHQSNGAFQNVQLGITPSTVGTVSILHGVPGLHLVDAIISRARGDQFARGRAVSAFLHSVTQPWDQLDLALGSAGVLVATCQLIHDVRSATPDRKDQQLIELGRVLYDAIDGHLLAAGSPADSATVRYTGMAHGWAGMLYALLCWAKVTGRAVSEAIVTRLEELARCSQSSGRGVLWYPRTKAEDAARTDRPVSGWCNGSAGFIPLWTLAHRLTSREHFAECAHLAGWTAWEYQDTDRSLCCGLVGRAYGILNLYQHSGDARWLQRARSLALRAMTQNDPQSQFRDSLFKGDLGLVTLAADLEDPKFAVMPVVEPERNLI
ncbi:MAG TPA: lanthionine synthetase LanC family protein [Tepidisphaeraceae bacterium]|nr:lanthionine synthetase LanC family protein [Tepidisphaeraceae bacterium]